MLIDAAAVLAVMGQAAESVPDGAVWLQTGMVGTDGERVAGFAEGHGITFVDCPAIGTRETAKQGRLVLLASGPGDALDRAQPVFDAIGTKTVRLGGGGVSRTKDSGDRLDRGARGDPPRPAEPRSALGALAQE